jgi:hypothetical protein
MAAFFINHMLSTEPKHPKSKISLMKLVPEVKAEGFSRDLQQLSSLPKQPPVSRALCYKVSFEVFTYLLWPYIYLLKKCKLFYKGKRRRQKTHFLQNTYIHIGQSFNGCLHTFLSNHCN